MNQLSGRHMGPMEVHINDVACERSHLLPRAEWVKRRINMCNALAGFNNSAEAHWIMDKSIALH